MSQNLHSPALGIRKAASVFGAPLTVWQKTPFPEQEPQLPRCQVVTMIMPSITSGYVSITADAILRVSSAWGGVRSRVCPGSGLWVTESNPGWSFLGSR